jgi:hypothetical protein
VDKDKEIASNESESKPKRNYHKESGYAAQKKYDKKSGYATHKKYDKEHMFRVSLRLHKEFRPVLEKLISDIKKPTTALFLEALEEKYGVILHKSIDNENKR